MKRFLCMAMLFGAVLAVAPLPAGGTPPIAFTLSPASLSFSTAVNTFQYQFVTVTTSRAVVIDNPATVTGVPARGDGGAIFFDTQAGSCWQQFEVFGNPIPANTSCTIQVGFHPDAAQLYSGTLTVTRCTHWGFNAFGGIACTSFDGSHSVTLSGTGT